jgi:hypothetical protein
MWISTQHENGGSAEHFSTGGTGFWTSSIFALSPGFGPQMFCSVDWSKWQAEISFDLDAKRLCALFLRFTQFCGFAKALNGFETLLTIFFDSAPWYCVNLGTRDAFYGSFLNLPVKIGSRFFA